MFTRRFTSLFLLAAFSCFGQQANGRNYTIPTAIVGNNIQWGSDAGVNGFMLTVPMETGAYAPASWGLCHVNEAAADSAGTNHHGCALYQGTTLKCSVYTTRTVAVGDNTYNLGSSCGTPAANTTYTLAYLTDWSGDDPGTNVSATLSSLDCPNTSSFSGFVAESSFPATLPATSAQSFCYTEWVTVNLAGQQNGRYYGGNAGMDHGVMSIPTGPWGNNGAWYGGQNSGLIFVSFSDGLSNGVLPTTTTLGNSTHGGSCTWAVSNANTVIAGSTSGHANLLTPFSVSGGNYGGASGSPLTFQYTTGTNRNFVTCTAPSTYTAASVGFHFKTDVPISDTQSNQYDAGGIESGDAVDQNSPALIAGGASLNIVMQCDHSGTGSNLANVIPIAPNTNYWIWLKKTTGAGTDFTDVFNQDQSGAFVGQVTCTANAGTHNVGFFFTTINGAQTNATGDHVWEDTYEFNTSGAFLAP